MTVLSDKSIKEELAAGRLVIKPLDMNDIQPASVDIHLDNKLRVFRPWQFPHYIDLHQPLDGLTDEVIIEKGHFSLGPGQFVLGSTREYIALPDDLMGRLEGKSSLGRIGLLVHSTAGYVDPGWRGHLTLELYNVSALPILLYPGMKVSQISFYRLSSPAERPYGTPGLGSKYMEQMGPTPTRYFQEFKQMPLLSQAATPLGNIGEKRRTGNASFLREWLKESRFRGSVKRFAEELGVPLKTVEEWLYRGTKPSPRYRMKLFSVTQLPQFQARGEGKEQGLLPELHS